MFYVIVFKHSFFILWISFAVFPIVRWIWKEREKIPGNNRGSAPEKARYIPSTVFFPAIFAFLRDIAEKNLVRTPLEKSRISYSCGKNSCEGISALLDSDNRVPRWWAACILSVQPAKAGKVLFLKTFRITSGTVFLHKQPQVRKTGIRMMGKDKDPAVLPADKTGRGPGKYAGGGGWSPLSRPEGYPPPPPAFV